MTLVVSNICMIEVNNVLERKIDYRVCYPTRKDDFGIFRDDTGDILFSWSSDSFVLNRNNIHPKEWSLFFVLLP